MKLYGKPKRYINSTDKVNNKVFIVSFKEDLGDDPASAAQ